MGDESQSDETRLNTSAGGVTWDGIARNGEIDKDTIDEDDYGDNFLVVGDTKDDSSYPVVGGDGRLYTYNLKWAWNMRGQGSNEQEQQVESAVEEIYNAIDVEIDAIEGNLEDADSSNEDDETDNSQNQNVLADRQVLNSIGGSDVQRVERGGREYLEFPIVPLREMVLNYPERGVREYVSSDRIQESIPEWSDLPLRPTHPERDRDGSATAKDADGYMGETVGRSYDPEPVGGDGVRTWGRVDIQKANSLGGMHAELVERLESGEVLPVSAGYDTVGDVVRRGMHNGERYDIEQGKIKPDHIAIVTGDEVARALPEDGVAAPKLNYVANAGGPSDDMKQRLRDAMSLLSAVWGGSEEDDVDADELMVRDSDGQFSEYLTGMMQGSIDVVPESSSVGKVQRDEDGSVSSIDEESERHNASTHTEGEEDTNDDDGGAGLMSDDERATQEQRIVDSDMPFDENDVGGWSEAQVSSVSTRLDGSRQNSEDEPEDMTDEDAQSSDDRVDEVEQRLDRIESERRESEREPDATTLREKSPLSDETVDSLPTAEVHSLAEEYSTGNAGTPSAKSGIGERQEQIESRSPGMAAAPGGQTRQNAMSMGDDEPDESLSGRDAYNERKGGGE